MMNLVNILIKSLFNFLGNKKNHVNNDGANIINGSALVSKKDTI